MAQKTQSTPSDILSNSVQYSHADDYASRVVDEYRDRESRKLNVIFHKIPESKSEEPTSRKTDDAKFVLNVAKEIGVEKLEIVNVVCLGQHKSENDRSLKVQVSNLNFKRLLLVNAKKLHLSNSEQLRKVFITPDLSLQERKVQRNLRSELKRRKDAGEFDLIIRRGQIVRKNVSDMAMSVDVPPPLLAGDHCSSDQSG